MSVRHAPGAPDPAGTVIDQSPKPGGFTSSHHVTLVRSDGPPNVAVPPVKGLLGRAENTSLDAAGFATRPTPTTTTCPKAPSVSVNPPGHVGTARSRTWRRREQGPLAGRRARRVGPVVRRRGRALTGARLHREARPDEFSTDVHKGNVVRTAPGDEEASVRIDDQRRRVEGAGALVGPDLFNLASTMPRRRLDSSASSVDERERQQASRVTSAEPGRATPSSPTTPR